VDVEVGNLRAAFRWAAGQGDVETATTIAAHTAILAFTVQRYGAVGWAEEMLPSASASDVAMLPRLYTAASLCCFTGRAGSAVAYAQEAQRLEREGRHDPFLPGLSRFFEAVSRRFDGDMNAWMDIASAMTAATGYEQVLGRASLLYGLPNIGRADEARAIADETLAVVRAYGNPWIVAFTLDGYGRAFADADPATALSILREGLAFSQLHRLAIFEAFFLRDAAALAAVCGNPDEALELFDSNIDALRRNGDVAHMATTLAQLAMVLARLGQPVAATTLFGATVDYATVTRVADLGAVVYELRAALGSSQFDQCLAAGAAMGLSEAAQYAQEQIQLSRETDSPARTS
jgi:hypothetical protein